MILINLILVMYQCQYIFIYNLTNNLDISQIDVAYLAIIDDYDTLRNNHRF